MTPNSCIAFEASSTPKRPLTADERLLEETNKILERENRRLQKSTPPSALATQLSSTRVSKSGTVNPKPIVYKDASSSSGYMFGEEEEGEEEELFHGEGLAGDPLVEEAEEEREEEGEEEGPVFTQQASRVAQIRCTDSEEEENVDTLHPASALSDGSSRNAFCSSEESVRLPQRASSTDLNLPSRLGMRLALFLQSCLWRRRFKNLLRQLERHFHLLHYHMHSHYLLCFHLLYRKGSNFQLSLLRPLRFRLLPFPLRTLRSKQLLQFHQLLLLSVRKEFIL